MFATFPRCVPPPGRRVARYASIGTTARGCTIRAESRKSNACVDGTLGVRVLEHNPEPKNPLGMDGIEFVEFATSET